jgi:cyclase
MYRRAFLTTGVAALALPAAAYARSPKSELVVTPLADKLTLISGAGGNITLFDSPEGVVLVDGGSPKFSARVLKTVRKLSGSNRVHTLFNTHWHWDQTGSNPTLGKAGTRIIAHENTRLWLSTDVDSKWEQRTYERLEPKARPNETFYTTGSVAFGGEQIDYGYLPQAHTDGDIYVFFRKANVLVAGDVVSVGAYPVIDYCTGGWIGGMADATKSLLAVADAATKIVPGKGPVQSRSDLQAEHEMLTTMKQRLAELLAQGMSIEDMIAARPKSVLLRSRRCRGSELGVDLLDGPLCGRIVGRADHHAQVRVTVRNAGGVLECELAEARVRELVHAERTEREGRNAPQAREARRDRVEPAHQRFELRIVRRPAVVEAQARHHAARGVLELRFAHVLHGACEQDLEQVAFGDRNRAVVAEDDRVRLVPGQHVPAQVHHDCRRRQRIDHAHDVGRGFRAKISVDAR